MDEAIKFVQENLTLIGILITIVALGVLLNQVLVEMILVVAQFWWVIIIAAAII